jgi:Mce-associated membrane protein
VNANWYDVLDVEPTATGDEIRAAWRAAVADLDPTDRRFRVFNQAAEVLLDPEKRAAYDAQRAAEEQAAEAPAVETPAAAEEAAPEDEAPLPVPTLPTTGEPPAAAPPEAAPARRAVPLVPGWVLVVVAALLAVSLGCVGILLTKPADSAVTSDTDAAQAAAEKAVVPLLSYDAHHLDDSQAAATPYMTDNERAQYDKLFAVIRDNAPKTGTVVKARYVTSGVVRSGTDRVDVLVFVNQVTTNNQHPKQPVVYKNQVTVTMAKVGGDWLVDNLTTNSDQP